MRFIDLSAGEAWALTLYALTAVLLLAAVSRRSFEWAPLAAVASIVSGSAASACLIMSYAGEPDVVYERPGPIERRGGGSRGYFEFSDSGSGSGATASGAAAPGAQTASAADAMPSGAGGRTLADGTPEPATLHDCGICPELVVVPAGFFRMGADRADLAAGSEERPGRNIGFGAPFAIGRYEVTVREFEAFLAAAGRSRSACGPDPAPASERLLPVECISPRDADAYAAWLSARTGRRYRLPSEAEWEYAARAGRSAAPALVVEGPRQPNVGRGDARPRPVGQHGPNRFGLYDVEGNVAEIVAGCWVATPAALPADGSAPADPAGCASRVLRDAHAAEAAHLAWPTARRPIEADARRAGIGFRIARDLR